MLAGHNSLLQGGDSGAAIVPGDPDRSLLIRMVRYEGDDFEMPPKGPLDPEQVDILVQWVREGAIWPGGDESPSDTREISLKGGREWWSFRPVVRPEVPGLAPSSEPVWSANAIDGFVLAKLESAGLTSAPLAEDRVLVRRLYLDLLGVQPTLEQLQRYLADDRVDRWSRLIDELLDRRQYGERWGRYWLDVVRFAQTNGYELDEEKEFIWRYRDYVIDAYNADKPYDEFLREQLAGDELDQVTSEGLVATGFYSLGMWDMDPNDAEQAIWDSQDDTLRTITEGMMGVTLGCARCHDHRTDPFRQEDYYSLVAFLRNVEPYTEPVFNFESRTHRVFDEGAAVRKGWEASRLREQEEVTRKADEMYNGHLAVFLEARFGVSNGGVAVATGARRDYTPVKEAAERLKVSEERVRKSISIGDRIKLHLLDEKRKSLQSSYAGELPWTMAVSETGTQPTPTHVLRRGMASSPLEPVSAGFIPVLCAEDDSAEPRIEASISTDDPTRSTSGQRLALANWITDAKHPTTARVMVNRIWQGHFGQGLVATPNDFGKTGELPSHPQLLDWLADEFVTNGWSLKYLHRLILKSATYRRASSFTTPEAVEQDPGNRLLWRQNMRRLDAEALHDSILAVCGLLNFKSGGRGYFPHLSLEALAGSSRPGRGWGLSRESERNRRAVYTYVKRGLLVPFLTMFDAPDPSTTQGKRASTTVANQALTLLNGEFTNRVALKMARQLTAKHGADLAGSLRDVYERIMLRQPTEVELGIALGFIESQERGFAARPARSTFRASAPSRIELFYQAKMTGEDALAGPRGNWDYFLGRWGNEYNLTCEALKDEGPFALLREPSFLNGQITFDMQLDKGCESVGFYLRASNEGELVDGVQIVFDVLLGELRLLQWSSQKKKPRLLAQVPCVVAAEVPHQVAMQIYNGGVWVSLDGQLLLDPKVENQPGVPSLGPSRALTGERRPGRFGVQTMGPALHLENLSFSIGGQLTKIPGEDRGSPQENALALFCLTVLNLNEFLYVD